MREYKGVIRLFANSIICTIVALLSVQCTDISSEVGSNFIPSDQEMAIGSIEFAALSSDNRSIFTTRSFRSDVINTANQGALSIGAQNDKYFGKRYTGFVSQYTPEYDLDGDFYGYDPILDSVVFYLSVSSYNGDTTTVIKYDVYELKDNTIFGDYDDDDAYLEIGVADAMEELSRSGVVSSEPLFSFYFPDPYGLEYGYEVYYSNSYFVTAKDMTSTGDEFMERLMHIKGVATDDMYDFEYNYPGFIEYFKGLYVVPSQSQPYLDLLSDDTNNGTVFSLDMTQTGFGFYGRSKYEDNPQFIKDTIGMDYIFYNSYVEEGGNSVGITFRDDRLAETSIKTAEKSSSDVTPNSRMLVESLGGIVTEITVEQSLFEDFKKVIDAGSYGEVYEDIFFNSAILSIYVLDADATSGYGLYNYSSTNEVDFDKLPTRLVLYSDYTNFLDANEDLLTGPALDYDYEYEVAYSLVSAFDGYLSRSKGCYVMNIPLQLQSMWSDYRDAMKERNWASFTQEEWDEKEWNKLYLAFDIFSLNYTSYAVLQGSYDDTQNLAPMRLELNYTLLKK